MKRTVAASVTDGNEVPPHHLLEVLARSHNLLTQFTPDEPWVYNPAFCRPRGLACTGRGGADRRIETQPHFNVLPRSPGVRSAEVPGPIAVAAVNGCLEAMVVIPATRAIGAVAENVIRTLAQRDAVHERQAKVTIRLPQFWFEKSTN